MGMPLLLGAGIGAISSAAMGKSPFTGALLGGATGGMLGGAGGLFGAAPTAGVSGLTSAAPAVATSAADIAIPSTSLLGAGTTASSIGIPTSALQSGIGMGGLETAASAAPSMGVQLASNPMMSGLNYGINSGTTLAGGNTMYQAPSFMDRLSNMPENAMNYVKNNPMSAGKMVLDVATPSPEQPIQPSQGQVSRPNFDPSSTLLNVSPNVRPTAGSKTGLIDMMARIPMTDEEKMRLQQLGYRG